MRALSRKSKNALARHQPRKGEEQLLRAHPIVDALDLLRASPLDEVLGDLAAVDVQRRPDVGGTVVICQCQRIGGHRPHGHVLRVVALRERHLVGGRVVHQVALDVRLDRSGGGRAVRAGAGSRALQEREREGRERHRRPERSTPPRTSSSCSNSSTTEPAILSCSSSVSTRIGRGGPEARGPPKVRAQQLD